MHFDGVSCPRSPSWCLRPHHPPSPILRGCCWWLSSYSTIWLPPSNPGSRPQLIRPGWGPRPHLSSHSLSPGNLEMKFSTTCAFSWLFELGTSTLGGLTSVGMQKQGQKWHSHTAKLDERTWKERGREREAVLILRGFLVSSYSFFYDLILLVSLGFCIRRTHRTRFGLTQFEWVLLNYTFVKSLDQDKLIKERLRTGIQAPCPQANIFSALLGLLPVSWTPDCKGRTSFLWQLCCVLVGPGPWMVLPFSPLPQMVPQMDDLLVPSCRLEQKSVLWPPPPAHLSSGSEKPLDHGTPDSCMTSNHLRVSF